MGHKGCPHYGHPKISEFREDPRHQQRFQQGVVENIGVRTTMLRTAENVQVLVPNAVVFGEVVSNHTHAVPLPQPSDGHAEAEQPHPSKV